ncbi:MAG: VOC family protein [Halieaceae bacterium]|nr:VOC family protein [Halieaceae bacterium]
MILGIYHVNINVTDIERSTEFYGLLGFTVVDSFHERGTPGLDRGLGMPYTDTRARFLALGNTRHETVLDLVEWIEPEASKPEIQLNQIGMPRLCLRVKDLDGEVERLKSHGVEFVSAPQVIDTLERKPRFVLFRDPDGIILELVELN